MIYLRENYKYTYVLCLCKACIDIYQVERQLVSSLKVNKAFMYHVTLELGGFIEKNSWWIPSS